MNPLKNSLAEMFAQKIAECLPDKKQASYVYYQFLKIAPNLKHWECMAIIERARFIYKEKTGEIKDLK